MSLNFKQILIETSLLQYRNFLVSALKNNDQEKAKQALGKLLQVTPKGYDLAQELDLTRDDFSILKGAIHAGDLAKARKVFSVSEKPSVMPGEEDPHTHSPFSGQTWHSGPADPNEPLPSKKKQGIGGGAKISGKYNPNLGKIKQSPYVGTKSYFPVEILQAFEPDLGPNIDSLAFLLKKHKKYYILVRTYSGISSSSSPIEPQLYSCDDEYGTNPVALETLDNDATPFLLDQIRNDPKY